ncbi:hypothetical protein LCGC14_1324620 [marine sediment metagenome]|uniref:Methyltransferase domain-containing protein n=1 Tax=marine sediment metagenome TaxID=412755 RepID=A0A0F9KJ25_9ZZZZ
MKRIRREACRYGEPGFDREYIEWGFHDRETQITEAQSVLRILNPETSARILDLACGIGTHAICWAKQGHQVTGVDISQTFIAEAKKAARREGVSVNFQVGDVKALDFTEEFDIVSWIEKPTFHHGMPEAIWGFLAADGHFIGDVRNPEHPRTRARTGNWRTWREEGGVFHLEAHETNEETGTRQDVWIRIDTEQGIIEEDSSTNDLRACVGRNLNTARDELTKAGFAEINLWTMEGVLFGGGEEPYWLWIVAKK